MKANFVRLAVVALMVLSMVFVVASPAVAEIAPIPLDQTVHGQVPVAENFQYDDEKRVIAYEDESIQVTVEYPVVGKLQCTVTRVKVADPSQIRTAMSFDSFDNKKYIKATTLAKSVNAVVAVNGDFFKYYDYGYLIRQGVKYREGYSAKHPRDILLIDDQGNFSAVRNATEETMAAYMAELPAERTIINTFSLGPVLVENGVPQEITTRDFQYRYKMQRVAVVQLGELEYAVVECDGKADASAGMSMAKFAEYIAELFPDCVLAYNLDGGGSTNVVVNGERIHRNTDTRQICDILYFASAQGAAQ